MSAQEKTSSGHDQGEPPALSVRSFGLTDPGRKRPSNEDQFLIAELTKAMQVTHTSLSQPSSVLGEQRGHLFLVADGMGGHNAGEEASRLVVTSIEDFTVNALRWFLRRDDPPTHSAVTEFRQAVEDADRVVIEEATQNPDLRGMGTTLTLAYVVNAQLLVMHVGDSRAYLYRQGTLTQLTRDHTFVADLVQAGAIRPEQAHSHPYRHVITNVVGGTEPGVRAESHTIDLRPQDTLLLCSDGLTDMLSPEDIGNVLHREPGPEAACRRLIELANARGGHDNITAIVASFRAGDAVDSAGPSSA